MALAAAADLRRLGGICAQDYDNRVRAVMSIRKEAARSVAGFQKAHRNLASHTRKMMGDLDAAQRQMAAEQHQKLTQFHSNLHASVMGAVHDLQRAHSDRAREMSDHIHDMGVSRHNMGVEQHQKLTAWDAARRQKAAEQRRELTDEHIRLEATVSQMRGQLAADVSDLHRAYSDFTQQVQARRSRKRKA